MIRSHNIVGCEASFGRRPRSLPPAHGAMSWGPRRRTRTAPRLLIILCTLAAGALVLGNLIT